MHWHLENIISSFLVNSSLLKRVSSLIFISLVFSYYIHAQENQIRFKHISLEDGLSQSTVFSIVQDSVGFMWFATRDGLNKYDGYNFTVYRPDPLDSNSISDTGIRRLLVDSRGYLWIITLTGKVDRFDQKHDTFVHYNLITGNSPKIQPPIARCIVQDFSDNIWIGTVEGTLYRFDWESDLFIRQQFNANEENNINNIHLQSMYADKSNSIWMGTWEGLVELSRKAAEYPNL